MSEEEKQHRATGRMSGWKRNRTHGWKTGKFVDDAFALNAEGNSEILKPFYDSFNSSLPEIPIRESVLKNLKKSYNISDHHAKIIGDVFYINREYLSYLLETVCHALLGDFAFDSQEEFQDVLKYFGIPEPEEISKTMFRLAIAKDCLLKAYQKECKQKSEKILSLEGKVENAKNEYYDREGKLFSALNKYESYDCWITVPKAVEVIEEMLEENTQKDAKGKIVLYSVKPPPCSRDTLRKKIQNDLNTEKCDSIIVKGRGGKYFRIVDVAEAAARHYDSFVAHQYIRYFEYAAVSKKKISQ